VKVGDGETIAKREGDQLLSGAAIAVISMVARAFASFLTLSKGFALDDIVEVKVHEPKPFNLPGRAKFFPAGPSRSRHVALENGAGLIMHL
jgi:hypothetical protein